MGRDFDRMAERIESLILAQRRLLGDISHEMRSPLARLRVALELARWRCGDTGGALEIIEDEAEQLDTLIGGLLTLTRLESGDGAQERKIVNLTRLVEEIAADADFEAQGGDRAVRVVASDECSVRGAADLLRSAKDRSASINSRRDEGASACYRS
jgi:signal transduction histidine kinase